MLILYTHYYFLETSYYDIQSQLIRNSKSGLELLRSSESDQYFLDGKDLDLYDTGNDTVYLKKMIWGIYQMSVSNARHSPYSFKQVAMNGYESGMDYTHLALYLVDHDFPLGYCGKSKITGDARLPKSGVKLSFIEGKTAENGVLVSGQILKSEKKLPLLNAKILSQVEGQFLNEGRDGSDTIINTFPPSTDFKRGFSQSTARIEIGYNAVLVKTKLSGNIKIIAPKGITIDSSAHLVNVLIVSPKVVISEGFSGSVQILTSDTLIVRTKAQLKYPSSVFMKCKGGVKSLIKMDSDVTFQGEIYQLTKESNLGDGIQISDQASVLGLVYTTGRLTLAGKIEGTVFCDKFFLNTAAAIYDNQLLDGRIDREALSKIFLFSNLLMDNPKRGFIKYEHEY
jgi:hypothetical protein